MLLFSLPWLPDFALEFLCSKYRQNEMKFLDFKILKFGFRLETVFANVYVGQLCFVVAACLVKTKFYCHSRSRIHY